MTQYQNAIENIISEEIKQSAEYDQVSTNHIITGLKAGNIVIPKNINRNISARAVGKGLTTKININLGTSENNINLKNEIEKLEIAVKYGADSIMDLSTSGDLDEIRKELLAISPVMVGTVPIYSVITHLVQKEKNIFDLEIDQLFDEIEKQAQQGVDFMTVHSGLTQRSLSFLENSPRTLGIVSRGGSLLKFWMQKNKKENPLYEHFDRLLNIALKYDVTLSLGDALRPGAQSDATDRAQLAEMLVLGELVEKCRDKGVQVIVEGPGHVPWIDIETNIKIEKKLCKDAPFYVLGPLTTDSAPGYDHITGAIGATAAAVYGADFLCCVTPAEHLCLPNVDDIKQGVVAFKIAVHSADISKGIPQAIERDLKMSEARNELCWEKMYKYSLDPEHAMKRKLETSQENQECSMCGKLCAIKVNKM